MSQAKEHIIFKSLTMLLVITLMFPSAIKLSHVFTHHNHKHDICKGEKTTHLHTLDLDCDFYKFQINKPFIFSKTYTHKILSEPNRKVLNLTYKFLINHRPLSFSLRGPPILV